MLKLEVWVMILTKPTGERVWCALFGNLFHYAYMVLCIIPDVTYCSLILTPILRMNQ